MTDPTRPHSFVRAQLPAILWALLIFTLSSIPSSKFPDLPFEVPGKIVHAVNFSVLCLLIYRALHEQLRFPLLAEHSLSISLLFTAAYGALDEFHQLFVPGRTADVFDFVADFIGGCIVAVILVLAHRRNARRPG